MKNKVLKVAVVTMLLITLTLADFILLGMNLVTYALENVNNSTSNENVKFAAYFKTEEGEVSSAGYEMSNTDMKLYLEVAVENEGYFDGVITLENSNFKLTQQWSKGIKSIDGNTITLERVRAGNTVEIEIGIEPIVEESYAQGMLNRESEINLTGNYINSLEKTISIEAQKKVKLTLLEPSDLATALDGKVITNRIYKIGEENKRIVQIELNSAIVGNAYPIKETTFEVALPKGVEEVQAIAKGTYATNGEADRSLQEKLSIDTDNNLVTISIENPIHEDGKISWKKDAIDSIVITLILSEETQLSNENYSIKSKVEFYGQQDKTIQQEATYNLTEEADGIIRVSIDNKEDIYKGKIYSKEEREYNSTTNIEVNYANLIESANIIEKMAYRVNADSEDKSANIQYKTTTISKSEFEKVLGTEGSLVIKDQNANVVREIKISDFENTEAITITYAEGVKQLSIEITKAVSTGIIRLNHTKVIKAEEYSDTQIDEIKYLVEQAEINYDTNYDTVKYAFARKKTLREITSEVGLTVTPQTLSAEENKKIQVAITLKTDNEKYELFENPTFTLKMPEGVKINSLSDGTESLLYGGLSISKLETVNDREIRIEIAGKQTEYVKSNINTQIKFTADVTVEKLMPNRTDKIIMQYENKGNTYNIESEKISVIASNSKIATYLKVENYNGAGAILGKHSDSEQEVSGELPIENEATIQVPVQYIIINNYDSAMTITPTVVATLTDKEGNKQNLINYEEQNITIEAGKMKVIENTLEVPAGLYYSEEINIEAIVKYTYSGTLYSVPNNIKLATESKEGFRELSVVDNKIQIETFTQLGDESGIRETDEIYEEQIIKYILEVTNISNEAISNLAITNRQENGNIFDLEAVEVINYVVSEEKYYEHRYAELEDTEKILTIDTLNPGETQQLEFRVVTKKVEPNNTTTANIIVSATGIETKQVQTLSNTVKEADLKVYSRNAHMEEVKMYTNAPVKILNYVENISGKELTDFNVKLYLSDGLTWNENYDIEALDMYDNDLDILKDIQYNEEENYIKFNVTKLSANEKIILSTTIHIEPIELDKASTDEKVNIVIEDIVSNDVKIKAYQSQTTLSIEQTVNIEENKKVKDGEKVIFTGKITNTGNVDMAVTIYDQLPTGLELNKVEVIKKGDVIEKDAGDVVDFPIDVEKGETIIVNIETIVNTSRISAEELTNKIWAIPQGGEAVISNEIIIQIENDIIDTDDKEQPSEEEIFKPEDIEKPTETPDEPENPDKPETPDEPVDPDNPQEPETPDEPDTPEVPEEPKYTISGNAWVDINKNGVRDENEAIKDVNIKIIDINNQNTFLKDENGNEIQVVTNSNGEYKIEGLPEGKYSVIFKYDTSLYELNQTMDIKDYIIESTDEKVAITSNIDLNSDKTIDLQLMELTEFDLKIDKYISKVIVQNKNGTKTSVYENKQLVKEEIQRKYLLGTNVLVEYTIEVSNIGELAGYVTEIIDYLPDEMTFHSELNTQWYEGEDGNLYNTSLANSSINPGESKTVKLVLLKTMTKENTGTSSNIAEISETINNKQYEDINLSNNQSKAEIIVSTATGTIITYTVAILNAIVIVAVGMYMIKKMVVGKERR